MIARTPPRALSAFFALAFTPALLLTCFLYGPGPAFAAGSAAGAPAATARLVERQGKAMLQARLVVRRDGPRRARVGVLLDLAPSWHVYWRNSGDTGLPPELVWTIPGARVGPTLWPAPRAFQAETSSTGMQSYGYESRVLLAADAVFATDAEPDTSVAVDADVLVCASECVPATFRLERALADPLPNLSRSAEEALFAEFAARLPDPPDVHQVQLKAVYSQRAIHPGNRFDAVIVVLAPGADLTDAAFFPDDLEPIELRVTGVTRDGADRHRVSLAGVAEPDEPIERDRLSGVLTLQGRDGPIHVEVNLPLPIAAAAGGPGIGLLHALLLALLGGLVLNLMPCVLPVLAIKVFSISEMAAAAHDGRGGPRSHGIAYTAGILGSMAILGLCVVALRAAGRSVGWGFQFQEPIYVAGICVVLVAFALNLFGVFEIRAGLGALGGLGQDSAGTRRSFFEGLLAVALATPCSAPFLGTAVGFAFAREPAVILAIFLAVGLGLAAPFALVTLVPAWARFVPRSGSWMLVVRSGLGFALLATVSWLLWIFGGTAGADGIVGLIVFLLGLAFSLWCFGLLQRSEHQRVALGAGLAVIVFGAAGLNAVNAQLDQARETREPSTHAVADATGWRSWSPEGVRSALDQGAPVFVRFTADWCITCKVNEKLVLSDRSILAAFERGGFQRFIADWTRRDDAIRAELARYGRAGVPLYLVYHPDRPNDPQLLPELLTVAKTLHAVRSAEEGS